MARCTSSPRVSRDLHFVGPSILCDTVASVMLDSRRRPHFTFSSPDNSLWLSYAAESSNYLTRVRCQACTSTTDCLGAGASYGFHFLRVPLPHPRLFRLPRNLSTQMCKLYLPLLLRTSYADLREHRSTKFPLCIFTKLY